MGLGRFRSEFTSFVESRGRVLTSGSGIFSQSNFGIVTKMGMTLMPNPGGYESFVSGSLARLKTHLADPDQMYTFPNEEDLAPLVGSFPPLFLNYPIETVLTLADRHHPPAPHRQHPRKRRPGPPRHSGHRRPRPTPQRVLLRSWARPAGYHPLRRREDPRRRPLLGILRHGVRPAPHSRLQACHHRR